MAYQAVADRWRDFYIIAGTSAATLVGLLFVGLSLHLRVVISRVEVRSLARVTLANFGAVLFVSLFMVIHQAATTAATQLVVSGAISLVVVLPSLAAATRSRTRTMRVRQLVMRFGLSAAGYIGLIVAGPFLTSRSPSGALGALVLVIAILMMVSLRNCWDLLVSVGEVSHLHP